MFTLWLIVAVLFIATGVYVLGTLDWNDDEKLGLFWAIFFGSLLWPLVLSVVIVAGPFAGLFWLGDRKRRAKEAAKDK
jgi:chromate transport protein ChrA